MSSIALIIVGVVMREQPPGIFWVAGISGVLVAVFWSWAAVASIRLHRLWARLVDYATARGGHVDTLTRSVAPPEVLLARGEAGLSRTVITLDSGVRIGDWEYVRDGGQFGTRAAYTWGYVLIPLATTVPHIVLDSRANQRVNAIGAGNNLDRAQVLSLEGDFGRHFTVYCPDGYGPDALYLLTPDVMADLIDTASGWDVEFIDDQVVFFRPGGILDGRDDTLATLVAVARTWERRSSRWSRWRDERVQSVPGVNAHGLIVSPRSGVHQSGSRLRDGGMAVVGVGIFIAAIVAMYAFVVADMIQS